MSSWILNRPVELEKKSRKRELIARKGFSSSLLDEKSPKMGNYVTEMETNCKKGFLFIS
jgi:hypothetical protein